jgi:hypothetical protein
LLSGVAVGAVIGLALGSDEPLPPGVPSSDCGPCSFTASQKAFLNGLAGGVVGLGLGAIIGALVGHREIVELTDRAPAR